MPGQFVGDDRISLVESHENDLELGTHIKIHHAEIGPTLYSKTRGRTLPIYLHPYYEY